MKLFLCEKPSQAKDIARNLGITSRKQGYYEKGDIVVSWCVGHLLAQLNPDAYNPELKKWTMAPLPFAPEIWKMGVSKNGASQFKGVQGLVKKADTVVISTDIDREGEAIGREVLDYCKFKGKVERLLPTALDDISIQAALKKIQPGQKTG